MGLRMARKNRHATLRPGFAIFCKTKVEVRASPPPPLRWLEQRLLATASRDSSKNARFRGVLAVAILRSRTRDRPNRGRFELNWSIVSRGYFGGSVCRSGWCKKSVVQVRVLGTRIPDHLLPERSRRIDLGWQGPALPLVVVRWGGFLWIR